MSEWTPKRVRSLIVACVIVSVPLGGSLTSILAAWLIPAYGWRSMFLAGAAMPLLLLLAFSFLLPESPKYLALRPALHPQLARALNRLLGTQRFDGTETFIVVENAKTSGNWLSTIWNSRYWRSTLFIWIAFTFNTLVLYIFTNNLPVLLDSAGQSAAIASKSLGLFSGGGVVGSIGGAFLMGLWGSRGVGSGCGLHRRCGDRRDRRAAGAGGALPARAPGVLLHRRCHGQWHAVLSLCGECAFLSHRNPRRGDRRGTGLLTHRWPAFRNRAAGLFQDDPRCRPSTASSGSWLLVPW
ncbi:MAG: MFS transporter [Steroidobacteraceae bacterium]